MIWEAWTLRRADSVELRATEIYIYMRNEDGGGRV